jgi:hypothetical protein
MATWYVNMATGSDAAAGTSRALAFLSISAAVTASSNGDTIYVAGTSTRSHVSHPAIDASRSNLTIIQDPEGDQPIWDGATLMTSAWTEVATDSWENDTAITTGLGIDAVTVDYLNRVNSRGSYYGTGQLQASAAAVNAAASGTGAHWFYTSASGKIRLGLPASIDPNTVEVCYVNRRDVSAIKLTGTGNRVSGIWGRRWQQSGQGGFVWLQDASGSGTIENCKVWDSGPHAFIPYGALTATANVMISGCVAYGGRNDGSCFTAYQTNVSGTLTGVVFSNCHVERHNHLNINGNAITDDASIALTGFYCHGDAGTPIAGVTYSGCTVYDQNPARATTAGSQWCNAAAISGGSSAAPASATVASNFAVRAIRCKCYQMSRMQLANHMTLEQCELWFDKQGLSGLSTYGGDGALSQTVAGGKLLAEGTLIVLNSTPQAINDSVIGIHVKNVNGLTLTFVNCTIVDAATSNNGKTGTSRTFVTLGADTTSTIAFHGCIFTPVSGTPDGIALMYSDGETAVTRTNCVYGGPFDTYGYGSTLFADPLTADTTGITLSAHPFVSTTDYHVSPLASLFTRRRERGGTTPASLLAGPYDGSFGALGYANTGGARVPRTTRMFRLSRT